jgi:hypothetical protein
MSLIRTTRRSGLTLIVLGLLGAAFFWATDPRYGPRVRPGLPAYDPRRWVAAVRAGGPAANPIDAATTRPSPPSSACSAACRAGRRLYLLSRRKV